MLFGIIILLTALTLSAVAEYYSIVGLMAIFSAAPIPVAIMGAALGIGKIVSTVFLHNNWHRLTLAYKAYLIPAVVVLMFLTSLGIFGLLSKAHSDQSLVTGDASSKLVIYDEKIRTERENIEANKKALAQMDAQVDQMLGRSDTERGAERAVQIRKNQARERASLQADIARSQKTIQSLNQERAPLAAEFRKVEAEVGPIKYIAALIYGDNPDQNILERAVRWVIILIVLVFDPLALCLILAGNKQLAWVREDQEASKIHAVAQEVVAQHVAPPDPPAPWVQVEPVQAQQPESMTEVLAEPDQPEIHTEPEPLMAQTEPAPAPDALPVNIPAQEPMMTTSGDVIVRPWHQDEITAFEQAHAISDADWESAEHDQEKMAMREWKAQHPESTIKEQRKLYDAGQIDELPWNQPAGRMRGFGSEFPDDAIKGDQFVRTDGNPSMLYKFNGQKWIQVDKSSSDQYAFDTAYIDHLIEKIESGEYDADLLSDAESEQIAIKLQGRA